MNQKQVAEASAPRLVSVRFSPAMLFALAVIALAVLLASDSIRYELVEGWGDPDSMLRLVEVRAFLDGQGWYDLTMARMAPPDGVFMHWSRLVDLPMALIVRLLEPMLGREVAEVVMADLWPPVLFVPFAAGLAAIAHRFAGWPAVMWSLILLVLSPSVTGLFAPARFDHHNVQAVLVAWLVAGLVRADRDWRAAAFAGMVAALSLAIGMEMLLVVAVSAAGLAIAWMIRGERLRSALIGFGGAFALTIAAAFFGTVSPDRWLLPVCDALSPFYLAVALTGGAGVAFLAATVGRGPATGRADLVVRGSSLVGLAALVLAVAAQVEPACLAGPYAGLDPRLGPIWLDHVSEAASVWSYVVERPWLVPVHYGAPIVAVVLGLALWRRIPADDRTDFALLLALVTVSTVIGMMQVRGLVPAQTLGAAVGAVLICAARKAAAEHIGWRSAIRRYVWLPLSPLALYFVFLPFANHAAEAADTAELAANDICFAELGKVLDREPGGLVVAPTNIGAFVLYRSKVHSILAAPYHRNVAGILASEAILAGPDGRATLEAVGGDYIALCRQDGELLLMKQRGPDGLAARLDRGERPDFVELLAESENLLAFRVLTHPADPAVTGSLPKMQLRPALN